jgi:hypothetical protein
MAIPVQIHFCLAAMVLQLRCLVAAVVLDMLEEEVEVLAQQPQVVVVSSFFLSGSLTQ